MTVALWLYPFVGLGYAGATFYLDCRRSERLRASCEFNLPGVLVALVVIAAIWPVTAGDDLRRCARRLRAARHRRALLRRIRTQSVCTARRNRSTV